MNHEAIPDVLRGMEVGGIPFRLVRNPAAGHSRGGQSRQPMAAEQAASEGYENGFRRGREEGARVGYEEGCRKAREEVCAQAEADVENAIAEALVPIREREARLRALLARIEAAETSRVQGMQDEMLALSFETVCAVLGAHAVQPETVRLHLSRLVGLLPPGPGMELHVHPQDVDLIHAVREDGRAFHAGLPSLRCVPDPDVACGGCVVVRASGGLDLRLETAIQRCRDVLLETRARRIEGART